MKQEEILEQLSSQQEFYEAQIKKIIDDILDILDEDLVYFCEKKIKDIFISNPEISSTMDKEVIRNLKMELRDLAARKKNQIINTLKDHRIWFEPSVIPDDSKLITYNTRIKEVLDEIGEVVRAIIAKYHFPEQEKVEYSEPKRFVRGKFMQTLAEKYWKNYKALAEIKREIQEIHVQREKESLSTLWDEIQ